MAAIGSALAAMERKVGNLSNPKLMTPERFTKFSKEQLCARFALWTAISEVWQDELRDHLGSLHTMLDFSPAICANDLEAFSGMRTWIDVSLYAHSNHKRWEWPAHVVRQYYNLARQSVGNFPKEVGKNMHVDERDIKAMMTLSGLLKSRTLSDYGDSQRLWFALHDPRLEVAGDWKSLEGSTQANMAFHALQVRTIYDSLPAIGSLNPGEKVEFKRYVPRDRNGKVVSFKTREVKGVVTAQRGNYGSIDNTVEEFRTRPRLDDLPRFGSDQIDKLDAGTYVMASAIAWSKSKWIPVEEVLPTVTNAYLRGIERYTPAIMAGVTAVDARKMQNSLLDLGGVEADYGPYIAPGPSGSVDAEAMDGIKADIGRGILVEVDIKTRRQVDFVRKRMKEAGNGTEMDRLGETLEQIQKEGYVIDNDSIAYLTGQARVISLDDTGLSGEENRHETIAAGGADLDEEPEDIDFVDEGEKLTNGASYDPHEDQEKKLDRLGEQIGNVFNQAREMHDHEVTKAIMALARATSKKDLPDVKMMANVIRRVRDEYGDSRAAEMLEVVNTTMVSKPNPVLAPKPGLRSLGAQIYYRTQDNAQAPSLLEADVVSTPSRGIR